MSKLNRLKDRDHNWQPPAFTPDYKTTRARSPQRALLRIDQSVGDLTGPVFGHADLGDTDADLIINYAQAGQCAVGQRIRVFGRVLDEAARPIPNTLVEIWQANAGGRYRHKNDDYLAPLDPNFGGCGRTLTNAEGRYEFRTILPAPYPWPNGKNNWRPGHIHFSVFGHAFAQRLITQCYFEGDPLIPLCPIVQTIPDAKAIDTLIARLDMDGTVPFDMLAYRFDIVLRGRHETFFDNRREGS